MKIRKKEGCFGRISEKYQALSTVLLKTLMVCTSFLLYVQNTSNSALFNLIFYGNNLLFSYTPRPDYLIFVISVHA